jgi:hypothetical protein
MGFDLRWPIAGLFIIYGLVLIGYGAVADRSIYERSLGVNINVWWGLGMLVFALVMGSLALRAARRSGP